MKSILYILFLLTTLNAYAQKNYILKGTVNDENNKPLLGATAVLLNEEDSLLAHYAVTDASGYFEIKSIPGKGFIFQLSFLGYQNVKKNIRFSGENKVMDLGLFTLKPDEKLLNTVTIEGEIVPIAINKDTIEYNANAFKTQANADVEALLRKLPGVEVEEDGTIKAQGKEVRKVLVDGKEFFGNDPKIATKNLPAESVEKVQVYDKKSDYTEFTGIEDGNDQKTINLNLKDDFKNGMFGNVMAGYGSDDRFETKLSLNKFSKKSRISIIGSSNNVNKETFTFQDYFQMSGGMAGMMQGGGRMEISMDGGAGMPFGTDFKSGYVTSGIMGLNYNKTFSPKSELTANYFLNGLKQEIDQTTERQYFLPDENFYFENSLNDRNSKSLNHQFSTNYRLKIDSSQNLRFRGNFGINTSILDEKGFNETFNSENIPQNNSTRIIDTDGDRYSGSGELSYQKRFGIKGRNLAVNLSGGINDQSTLAQLWAQNQFYTGGNLSQIDSILQSQDDGNDQLNYAATVSYTEPIGKRKYLTFNATQSTYSNLSSKDVYDLYPVEVFNDELSNNFKRNYLYQRGGVNFRLNKNKFNFTVGAQAQRSSLRGKINGEENEIKRVWNNILPSMNWDFDLKQSTNLNISYRTSIQEPSLEQLQPIINNSNPLSIYVGNPNLRPEYNHRISARFFSFSQFSSISFFAQLNATFTENNIGNSKTIDESFRETTQPINSGQANSFRANMSFSAPVKFINSRIRLMYANNYSTEIAFINEQENEAKNLNNTIKLSLNNRNTEKMELSMGVRLNRNSVKYSLQPELNQVYLNHSYYARIAVFPFKNIALKQNIRYNFFDNGDPNARQEIPLWGGGVSVFFKERRLELAFNAIDILNRNLRVNQSGSSNFLQTQRINSLGRYFMISLTYKLKKFGNGDDGDFVIERI